MFISFRQQQKPEISRDFRPETGTRRTVTGKTLCPSAKIGPIL
jgi:hypothetical protein